MSPNAGRSSVLPEVAYDPASRGTPSPHVGLTGAPPIAPPPRRSGQTHTADEGDEATRAASQSIAPRGFRGCRV
jgi:hypothetical protein